MVPQTEPYCAAQIFPCSVQITRFPIIYNRSNIVIRSSTRFVSYRDIKPLMADLKKIYTAVTEDEALENLMTFKEKCGKQYPSCVKSWEDSWDILSTFFTYPTEIRKIKNTTNIIEGLNRQFRQITKNKPSFTNDDSLRRILYLDAPAYHKALAYSLLELGSSPQPAGQIHYAKLLTGFLRENHKTTRCH